MRTHPGKDSVVSLELYKKNKRKDFFDIICYFLKYKGNLSGSAQTFRVSRFFVYFYTVQAFFCILSQPKNTMIAFFVSRHPTFLKFLKEL